MAANQIDLKSIEFVRFDSNVLEVAKSGVDPINGFPTGCFLLYERTRTADPLNRLWIETDFLVLKRDKTNAFNRQCTAINEKHNMPVLQSPAFENTFGPIPSLLGKSVIESGRIRPFSRLRWA